MTIMQSKGPRPSLLLLGGAAAGKTTLLAQLFGRLQHKTSAIRLRSSPAELTVIRAALQRLAQGVPVEHTPRTTKVDLRLPCEDASGTPFEIVLPEYAGEIVDKIVDDRRASSRLAALAREANEWVFCVRLDKHPDLPDILSHPVDALAPTGSGEGGSSVDQAQLPMDLWLIELLQILLYEIGHGVRGHRTAPRLTVLLTCWDEIIGTSQTVTTPRDMVGDRVPLLLDFVESQWESSSLTIVGVSAQGTSLDEKTPDEAFIDQGPESMGYLVRENGSTTADLTELLRTPSQ